MLMTLMIICRHCATLAWLELAIHYTCRTMLLFDRDCGSLHICAHVMPFPIWYCIWAVHSIANCLVYVCHPAERAGSECVVVQHCALLTSVLVPSFDLRLSFRYATFLCCHNWPYYTVSRTISLSDLDEPFTG